MQPYVCVCVHTHTHTSSLEGEGKGESACIWLGDREAANTEVLRRKRERETDVVCTFAFGFSHFLFSPSTVLKVAALKGNNHYLLSKGIDPAAPRRHHHHQPLRCLLLLSRRRRRCFAIIKAKEKEPKFASTIFFHKSQASCTIQFGSCLACRRAAAARAILSRQARKSRKKRNLQAH